MSTINLIWYFSKLLTTLKNIVLFLASRITNVNVGCAKIDHGTHWQLILGAARD